MHGDVGLTSARTRARMVERLRAAGIRDENVLNRMNSVRRHIFLESAVAAQGYDDVAVPIGYSQTMSKPYVVARMTELALNGRTKVDSVLDIGCGSGYQAAVLAGFARRVYAIERIGGLVTRANEAFKKEHINNVYLTHGDGFEEVGMPNRFDIIMVAAAPEKTPKNLLALLAHKGRLVIPVGGRKQHLEVHERSDFGITKELHDDVLFVPMLKGLR